MASQSALLGAAGEHYVMSQLLTDYATPYGLTTHPRGWMEQYRNAWHLVGAEDLRRIA